MSKFIVKCDEHGEVVETESYERARRKKHIHRRAFGCTGKLSLNEVNIGK